MTLTLPSISIITACFNSEATLEATLRSVAVQVWPHREHIVIDGASTDGTLAIVEGNRHGLSHVVSEPDRGIYDAMNKGIALATGDVVAFLNSDDRYLDREALAGVARVFREEGVDAVFGDVDFVHPDHPDRVVRRYSSAKFRPSRIGWGWMPAHPALFVRRRVFDEIGAFRADYLIAGDFEFVARAFTKSTLRYAYLPRVLVRMQLGGASTSGLKSTLRLNSEILRACRENGIPSNPLKLLWRYPAKLTELFGR